MDAFKKFGSDAPGAKERVAALVADIEDLGLEGDSGICKRTGKVKTKFGDSKIDVLDFPDFIQITFHGCLIAQQQKILAGLPWCRPM